ncbi:nitroreductase family deazaflavin-dependent oxidoreductase [Antrihabitans cavernicola]|uniref:Nitroreductase family deazaflavin-dependent oxidoreductase n=1 Tax=Antrihabitans cavernicola TaxID=2495913 RepID=A0A5A7SFI5_9NOCA|nr:nitroreductase family deazaflavin-dependent oxidoreductase [Spelaeibacter cavernicola]KAA0023001.1 nitroreductase family deazaflavin-dependent oxidoreductase [Spelaeibacter cavernicola]
MSRNPIQKVARRIGTYPWLMRLAPQITWTEATVRRLTNDRVSVVGIAGLPSIQITVLGRRTGLPRTTSLLYVPYDDDSYLVTGSNWGRPKHPVWTVNLMNAETATVRLGKEMFQASVRLIDGVERKLAWDAIVEFWPGYEMEYELAGHREFRIIQLRRISS